MKSGLICAYGLAVLAGTAGAAEFPYGVTDDRMTMRFELSESAVLDSLTTPVAVPSVSAMPRTDSLATTTAVLTEFAAFDDANWTLAATAVPASQAALTMRVDGTGVCSWWGRGLNGWCELGGATAAEGEWEVGIDIDYSLGAGNRKVRYSVRSADAEAFAVLSPVGAADSWLALGRDDETLTGVSLRGFGEVEGVLAKSGQRPGDGEVGDVISDIGPNYDRLGLDVTIPTEYWGFSRVKIVLKDSSGTVVGSGIANFADAVDGKVRMFFPGLSAGASYTYETQLLGDYHGAALEGEIDASDVEMMACVDWFGFADSAFVKAEATDVSISGGAFGAAPGQVGRVQPTTASGEKSTTTVTATLKVRGAFPEAELPLEVPQFALAMVRRTDGSRSWMCNAGGTWTAVANAQVGVDNGDYEVKVDLDYRNSPQVAYSVRVGGEYLRLSSGSTEWFAIASDKTRLARVAVRGGTISALNAAYKTVESVPSEIDTDKHEIVVAGSASIDLSDGKIQSGADYEIRSASAGRRYHVRWTDDSSAGGKYATLASGALRVTAGRPANGLESFSSYVLGLNPTEEFDKPAAVVKSGGLQSKDGVTVHVPNVTPDKMPDSGYEAFFQLQRSEDGGTNWSDVEGDAGCANVGEAILVPFTSGVLYRVNTMLR